MSELPELEWLREWVTSAEADLRAAKHLLTMEEDCPYSVVCFHAQQGGEKYLKAVLASKGQAIPRTHDLRRLLELVSEAIAELSLEVSEILPLNRYSVETRYPGFWDPIEESEAREALRLAERILGRCQEPPASGAALPTAPRQTRENLG